MARDDQLHQPIKTFLRFQRITMANQSVLIWDWGYQSRNAEDQLIRAHGKVRQIAIMW